MSQLLNFLSIIQIVVSVIGSLWHQGTCLPARRKVPVVLVLPVVPWNREDRGLPGVRAHPGGQSVPGAKTLPQLLYVFEHPIFMDIPYFNEINLFAYLTFWTDEIFGYFFGIFVFFGTYIGLYVNHEIDQEMETHIIY